MVILLVPKIYFCVLQSCDEYLLHCLCMATMINNATQATMISATELSDKLIVG